MNLSAGSWDLVWSFVHRVLAVNAFVALANLPLLLALSVVHDPWHYPVFFGLLALSVGPSLAGAFGYLGGGSFRPPLLRALAAWAVFLSLVAALVVDARAVPALLPLFAATAAVALAVVVRLLALLPALRGRALLLASMRGLLLGLVNAALLGVAAVLVNQAPLLALATVPGCVLIVVHANLGRAAPALQAETDTRGRRPVPARRRRHLAGEARGEHPAS
jgi:hypothetical protein